MSVSAIMPAVNFADGPGQFPELQPFDRTRTHVRITLSGGYNRLLLFLPQTLPKVTFRFSPNLCSRFTGACKALLRLTEGYSLSWQQPARLANWNKKKRLAGKWWMAKRQRSFALHTISR